MTDHKSDVVMLGPVDMTLSVPKTSSEGSIYMGGRGIIDRTDELIDRLWDALPGVILGWWIGFGGPFLSWAFIIHAFSWERPPASFEWAAFAIVTATSLSLCALLSFPYFAALRTLRRHRKNIERETAKRGRGWARS